jgi:hypothetical protein
MAAQRGAPRLGSDVSQEYSQVGSKERRETEDARAVLIAEGTITPDGELAAEYRPAASGGKLQG